MSILAVQHFIIEGCRTGFPTLKIAGDDGTIKAIHSAYDPVAEAKTLVDAFKGDGQGIIVVLGLGLGYHVNELMERFPDARIVVVEAVPEIYEIAKDHGFLAGLNGKIRFIVGSTPDDVLNEIGRCQLDSGMPPVSVFPLSSALSIFPDYYGPVMKALQGIERSALRDHMRYPKFTTEKLRVLVLESGYFLNRELRVALKRLGHDVRVIKHAKGDACSEVIGSVMRTIVDFKPDFLLFINHMGFDEEGVLASVLASIELPAASWFVDSPYLIVSPFRKNVSPYVSLFLWDRTYIDVMKEIGFEHVDYLPLGTDESVFRPVHLSRKMRERFSCQAGFVGNSMTEKVTERLKEVPRDAHGIAERLADRLFVQKATYIQAVEALPEEEREIVEGLSIIERRDLEAAVLWKATLMYRLSCVRELREFHPWICGDRGWLDLLGDEKDAFKILPQLGYYEELPLFYNACQVNFNATSLQMQSAVNQRVFDVPACGAFLLTDHQEAIEEFFDVGKEVITYREKDEIADLVRFYLNHTEERRAIAQKGRERVLKEHTYQHRLAEIIERMRERYGPQSAGTVRLNVTL